MKKIMAMVGILALTGIGLNINARPHQEFSQDAQQQVVNTVVTIINSGFNIAMNDDNPEAQFNAGLNIASSLGSLIFHLARSIDPEDLRSMTEEEITNELLKLNINGEVQKRTKRLIRK
jgi:hypothetical protein